MRWEYAVIVVEDGFVEFEQLNEWGGDGWELVSVVTLTTPITSSSELKLATEVVPEALRRYAKLGQTVVDTEVSTGSSLTTFESEQICVAYLKRQLV
jgi:hypothetical protein